MNDSEGKEKDTDASIDYLPRKIVDSTRWEEIPRIYNHTVLPIVEILEKAHYYEEGLRLSQTCSQALLYGAAEETVQAMALKKLRETAPDLYADLTARSPELGEE